MIFFDVHTHHLHNTSSKAIISLYNNFTQSIQLSKCSIGLHPWYLQNAANDFILLEYFAKNNNVKAIGECGLDKICETEWQKQITYFNKQITLATQLRKPLIIHCVRAYNECMQLLKAVNVPVIFHGFNKNISLANSLIQQGFYLSFGADLYKEKVANTFLQLPLHTIFLETDDSPIDIETVYKKAAEIKNISVDTLILQIENNYKTVFENGR